EQVVKAVVTRERPATSVGDVHLRGDAPAEGESFVSGHAVLAAALATVVAPHLPGRWRLVPWVLVALVAFGRVYVGARLPLDGARGPGLGVARGAAANVVRGPPAAPGAPGEPAGG